MVSNENTTKFEKPSGYKNINTSVAINKPSKSESSFSFKGFFKLLSKISPYSSNNSSRSSS